MPNPTMKLSEALRLASTVYRQHHGPSLAKECQDGAIELCAVGAAGAVGGIPMRDLIGDKEYVYKIIRDLYPILNYKSGGSQDLMEKIWTWNDSHEKPFQQIADLVEEQEWLFESVPDSFELEPVPR